MTDVYDIVQLSFKSQNLSVMQYRKTLVVYNTAIHNYYAKPLTANMKNMYTITCRYTH